MKKQERHQIKRDDLATALESASDYVESHLRTAIIVGAAVVIAAVAIIGGRAWWGHREAESSRLLGDLIRTYNAPITATIEDLQQANAATATFTSAEERERKVIEMADGILAGGGSGAAMAGALLYKGMAEADLKQYDEAGRAFEEVVRRKSGDLFGMMAQLRLARLREDQGKPADALTLYQAIADDTRGLVPREEGLVGMARCQQALGKKDEARKIYQRIMTEFPGSEYAGEARTRTAEKS